MKLFKVDHADFDGAYTFVLAENEAGARKRFFIASLEVLGEDADESEEQKNITVEELEELDKNVWTW